LELADIRGVGVGGTTCTNGFLMHLWICFCCQIFWENSPNYRWAVQLRFISNIFNEI